MDRPPSILLLMGPTATSKSALAALLYAQLPIDIISVDSAQIYRGMDIGTAKPTLQQRLKIPHYLIDILEPTASYSVAAFRDDALSLIAASVAAGRIPLLVGGTMLYFKVLLQGLAPLPACDPTVREAIQQRAAAEGWTALYQQLKQVDPVAAARIHSHDTQRIMRALEIFLISGKNLTQWIAEQRWMQLPYTVLQFALMTENKMQLHQRIKQRFYHMLQQGFEHEVSILQQRGDLHLQLPSMRCVGYRQMWCYLNGEMDRTTLIAEVLRVTNQLAKRQMTWLKQWRDIQWLESTCLDRAVERIMQTV